MPRRQIDRQERRQGRESLLARARPPLDLRAVAHTHRISLQVGSYHYTSGVEASSSASLAAYLNSLQFELEEMATWFSKGPSWKVRSGTYW